MIHRFARLTLLALSVFGLAIMPNRTYAKPPDLPLAPSMSSRLWCRRVPSCAADDADAQGRRPGGLDDPGYPADADGSAVAWLPGLSQSISLRQRARSGDAADFAQPTLYDLAYRDAAGCRAANDLRAGRGDA